MSVKSRPRKRAALADRKAREFLRKADPVLARLIDARPGFRPRAWMDELPPLDAFSTLVVHVGPAGAGIRAKLARQLITYSAYYATACASEIATRAGVDLDALAKAIRQSDEQTGGPATQQFARRTASLETREHQAAACHKDIGAARDLAASLGIELPLADLVLASVDDIYRVGARHD